MAHTKFTGLETGQIYDSSGAAVAQLTDSSGGTASDTLAAITAGASYSQTDLTAIKNAIASLAAKINSLTGA